MSSIEQRAVGPCEDPVCAMKVDPVDARRTGLSLAYEETDFSFCSTTCFRQFRDDPAWFLDPSYVPTMM